MRVSLDRHCDAARPYHLFSVEQLPPGAEFDVHLRWNDADEDQLASFRVALVVLRIVTTEVQRADLVFPDLEVRDHRGAIVGCRRQAQYQR